MHTTRRPLRWLATAVALSLIALLVTASESRADLPAKVKKAFQGKVLFSTDELPSVDADDPQSTIAAYKKASVSKVTHTMVDGLQSWTFHFMAFMKGNPSTGQVSLDFYTADKEKLFVAQVRLQGVNKSLSILSSRVNITEDDGLKKGGIYNVKLSEQRGKKEVILAEGKLTTL